MTLQSAAERAMKIIAKFGDSLDSISIGLESGVCWYMLEANGDTCGGYFSVAAENGKIAENLLLSQCGKLTPQELLSDKWEVKAIKRVYITADELNEV